MYYVLKKITIVIYFCRVQVQSDISRGSIDFRPKTRRATGYVRKSISDEDDDEEHVEEEFRHKKVIKRRATGFVHKQDILQDSDDEEEELVEGKVVEEEVLTNETLAKGRASGYNLKKDFSLDEEEAKEVDQERKPQKKTPVYRRRVTPYVRKAPFYDDNEESIEDGVASSKKSFGFVADEDLENIRIMSKQGVNKVDSDTDEG